MTKDKKRSNVKLGLSDETIKRIKELEKEIKELRGINLDDKPIHFSNWAGKHRQFLNNPPHSFDYDGLFYLLCTKIHDDEYFVCYKVGSQSIPNKGACNIQLVYLFKKLSSISRNKCIFNKCDENLRIVSTHILSKENPDVYDDWPLEPFTAIGFDVDETF